MASPEELLKLEEHLYELSGFLREMGKRPFVWENVTLSDGELRTLMEIARQEGQTQTDLARKLFRGKAAISLMVDTLEKKGLVLRERRGVQCFLTLTDLGQRVCRAKAARDLRAANQMSERLPVELEELAEANTVLEEVIRCCRANSRLTNREE